MITYKEACNIAKSIRSRQFPDFICTEVVEINDRWSFTFSICAPDDERRMTPPPSFFVYKEDGHVEWYAIPPLENLDLLESGKVIAFLEEA